MSNYFFKPELENLSQGARLKFVRELRYMSKSNVAEFLQLGGDKPTDSVDKYERNAREPQPQRLETLAELFNVSDYAIRKYNFVDPPEVKIEKAKQSVKKLLDFNYNGINDILIEEVVERITVHKDWFEWKLVFLNEPINLEVKGKKQDYFIVEHKK